MSNPIFFIESIPKRPEVTGTPEQAFSFVGDFTNTLVKLIQTKTISALGTVKPGLTTLQYLVNPSITTLWVPPLRVWCKPGWFHLSYP
jgi:hypothetical protein